MFVVGQIVRVDVYFFYFRVNVFVCWEFSYNLVFGLIKERFECCVYEGVINVYVRYELVLNDNWIVEIWFRNIFFVDNFYWDVCLF